MGAAAAAAVGGGSDDPDAVPVAGAPAVEEVAPAPPPPAVATTVSRTIKVQAGDGTAVEVVANGQVLTITVEGTTFRIKDAQGLELVVGE